MHYAALSRDSFDAGARVRITASYALGFPNRGRRLFNLLVLDLQIRDGVATVTCARRLGRLVPALQLADALMALAIPLAESRLPSRTQLAPFMPQALLDVLESECSAADFPDDGVDREEKVPEALWNQPSIIQNDKINVEALAISLNLAVGERVELVDIDPATGDYRVFYLDFAPMPSGSKTLTFELHRQGAGSVRRIFNVLSLTLGRTDIDGLCPVDAFTCDTGAALSDLLPMLARIAAALQDKKRPEDALILPFLSKPAQALWNKAPVAGGVA